MVNDASNNIGLKTTTACSLLAVSFLFAGAFSGCATKPSSSAAKRSTYQGPVPTYYTVRRGDTVSKIAARYGLNWRDVAAINHLDANYTIYVNQRLKLKGSIPKTNARSHQVNYKVSQANLQTRKLDSGGLDSSRINQPTPRPQTASASATTQGWFRPARGQIFQKFNPKAGIKGIRFTGSQGDPVFASKAGEVIYASDGLKEYGNLVLIRHTDGYISAYAHNDNILVNEGERVATGKQIATLGSSGASRPMLEFQIRKDGKPIDPLSVMNP